MVIDRGKGSKIQNEVKKVENINKNPQSFLKTSPLQNEVSSSHKLQKLCMSNRILSNYKKVTPHREIARTNSSFQVSHKTRISGESESKKNSHPTKLGRRLN